MLNLYAQWNEELTKPSRSMYGEVELLGSTPTIFKPEGELVQIKWEKTPTNGKFFGYSISQKATIELRNSQNNIQIEKGQQFIIKLGAAFDKTKLVKSPVFEVSEVKKDTVSKKLTITGYDLITEAKNHKVSEIDISGTVSLCDVSLMMQKIANILGTSYKYINNSNIDISIDRDNINWSGEEDIRTAIDMLAELTGTICYINYENKLTFRELSKSVDYTIKLDDYFTYNKSQEKTLTQLIHSNELGDNISVGADGTAQTLFNNCYLSLLDSTEISEKLSQILQICNGLVFSPYSLKWRGNPALEIGDYVKINTKNGVENVYYIGETLTYNGGLVVQADMIDEKVKKPNATPSTVGEVINQTFAKVDKVNKEITLGVKETQGDINSLNNQISSIKTNVGSITASVSNIETKTIPDIKDGYDKQIQEIKSEMASTKLDQDSFNVEIKKQIDDGVKEITTTSGYKFDDKGLSITKSGQPLSTTISENGMTIKDNSTEVLTAKNTGVDAKNLHATTYLIIGDNSRFEDWGNRTACFWIGG